jgi:hypothetical protein
MVDPDDVGAEIRLYKLLLYPVGGHFTFHRDSVKEEGMFATFVAQLPSEHTGGTLVVRQEKDRVTISHGADCSSEIVTSQRVSSHQRSWGKGIPSTCGRTLGSCSTALFRAGRRSCLHHWRPHMQKAGQQLVPE